MIHVLQLLHFKSFPMLSLDRFISTGNLQVVHYITRWYSTHKLDHHLFITNQQIIYCYLLQFHYSDWMSSSNHSASKLYSRMFRSELNITLISNSSFVFMLAKISRFCLIVVHGIIQYPLWSAQFKSTWTAGADVQKDGSPPGTLKALPSAVFLEGILFIFSFQEPPRQDLFYLKNILQAIFCGLPWQHRVLHDDSKGKPLSVYLQIRRQHSLSKESLILAAYPYLITTKNWLKGAGRGILRLMHWGERC